MRYLALCLFFLVPLLMASSLISEVPQMINYQGKVTDPDGNLIEGTHQIIFSIYDILEGGSPLWADTQSIVIENGLFNVLLGSVHPIPENIFNGAVKYLGVKVEDDSEINPRTELVSVPYAFRSGSDNDWIIDGDNLYCLSDYVGIGTNNFDRNLTVQGDIMVKDDPSENDLCYLGYSTAGAGFVATYGPNGEENTRLTNLSGYPDHGHISVRNSDGDVRANMYVNDEGSGNMYSYGPNGSFNAALTTLAGYPNNGFIYAANSSGIDRAPVRIKVMHTLKAPTAI